MKKVVKIISSMVLIIAFLSFFAHSVKHVINGGNRFGPLTKPFKEFIFFISTVEKVFNEVTTLPETYAPIDSTFRQKNALNYNVYALNAHHQTTKNQWVYRLLNLRNDSIIHNWVLKKSDFFITDREFSNSVPFYSILLKDRSIITLLNESNNLFRLDKESNIIWHNTDKKFHHSLNLGDDGNIWACTADESLVRFSDNNLVKYEDNYITKIDPETGKIIYDKSVSEILIENGYINLLYGYGNSAVSKGTDPLHLNDIEPVLFDGEYWKKGDLFLSLRHRSLIIQYRPISNRIIRLLHGPFLNQHDVDIISETQISLFNNNVPNMKSKISSEIKTNESKVLAHLKYSEILAYNFKDSTYQSLFQNHFQSENIFTATQGLHQILSNGDMFIECQNNGKIYILNKDNVLLKRYINEPKNGYVEMPHWVRIYEELDI